jgi:tRNA (uracil-5-)-methyltransferase
LPPNGLLIAFFQVNTTGAEALCELLRSLVGATKETVLLDVCCGTGTLGLSLASSVKRLIGIEMCAPAVEDARANAARNGITNALFIAKKAEEATLSVLENLSAAEKRSLVAIVDPPRAGLHTDVLKALRGWKPAPALGVPPEVVTEPFTVAATTVVLGMVMKARGAAGGGGV